MLTSLYLQGNLTTVQFLELSTGRANGRIIVRKVTGSDNLFKLPNEHLSLFNCGGVNLVPPIFPSTAKP